jgi:predicted metal-dependent enzyme (double-stranded beta helix superfamily)
MPHISRRALLAGAAGLLTASATPARHAAGGRAMSNTIDLDRFVDDVKGASPGAEGQRAVDQVLARTVAEPNRLIAGLGEPRTAGLHTLHHSPNLTILNVVWAPLMILFPHNHNMWASIAIYTGREDNIIWERQGSRVEAIRAASLPTDAVHSVSNPIRRLTGAIHVYGGDFFAPAGRYEWDPETLTEKPLDIDKVRALFGEANQRFQERQ